MPSMTPTQIPSQQRMHLTQSGEWKRCRARSEETCGVKSKQHRSEPSDSVHERAVKQAQREGEEKMRELRANFSPEQIFDATYQYSIDFISGRFNGRADFALRSSETEVMEIFRAEFPALLAAGKVTPEAVERFRTKLYNLTLATYPEELEYYKAEEASAELVEMLSGALEIEQAVGGSYGPGERAYSIALELPDRSPGLLDGYKDFDWDAWAKSPDR